ncbi:acyltransferase family protein [Pseudonocardia sp. HH130630-07]|uniref:acyltransferase family protein n=1 Tax=Pseudonocardia sp. HH130630-07 TaxID=1690815 RepID=UPI000814C7AD|nr:acyltransferase [Pseudonocardia sp. HH130630-07]ANY06617.1 hypothetical protein AFB00_10290 [Pseudonocardia sp. HH130630-07]
MLAAGSLLCVTPLAAAFVVVGSPYYPYSWLVRILGGFSAGVLAMLAVRRLRHARVGAVASGTATAAAVGVPVVLVAGDAYGGGAHGAAVLLFPVLVGALALADRGPVHHLLTRPAVVHGGRISYALYLVHIPVFEVFWFLSDTGAVPAGGETGHLIALTVFVGTLPVAHLLHQLVERPARRWLRALPGRRAAAVPAVPAEPPAPVRVDTTEARRDPETCVLPAVAADGHRVTTEDARRDPDTSVLPVVVPGQGTGRTAVERLVAARAAGAPRSPGAGLFTPLADGPGGAQTADRVERLRALQLASRTTPDADVPTPRVQRTRSGSRTGVEYCGRRRRDTHGSAATPIVAASGAAARRRRRPAHGA